MRRIILICLVLAVTATTADARRRHHRHFHKQAPVMLMVPGAFEAGRSARGDSPAQLIPPDWQLQPPAANWQGRRYTAPDGSAWLAFYATHAANDAPARFKAVAFADGEEVTYLHGERNRLTVSGLKGDRIFYRKVMLACGGTSWRHLALEYPAESKLKYDRFVERLSRGFDWIAQDDCGQSLFTTPQPAAAIPQPAPDAKPAAPESKPAQ